MPNVLELEKIRVNEARKLIQKYLEKKGEVRFDALSKGIPVTCDDLRTALWSLIAEGVLRITAKRRLKLVPRKGGIL